MTTELYRRFRPITFEQVVGQDETVKILTEKVRTNTVPHALMLSGPSGTGKTTIARILKRTLGCEEYTEINAAESRGIDTIRSIIAVANYGVLAGKARMYVFDEAHKLTSDAQNSLLKLLEDCPPQLYFILCTTEPDGLITTIRNRCTNLALKPIHQSEMATLLSGVVLKINKQVPKSSLEKIVEISDGSARRALVLLEKILPLEANEQINSIESEDVKKKSESIAKLIMAKAAWKDIASCLKDLKGEEPERIRRMILGYAGAILLNTGNKRAYFILDAFDGNLYSSGFPGLARCCFYATQM
jgi:DNA polymerase-3 subunit gamma/tau